MQIAIGARVRTREGRDVGEVHRVVVDLEQEAVTGIVVLKGRWLSRDILVPIDFVDQAGADGVTLRLTVDEVEALPDFSFNEVLTPPPTWAFPLPYPGGAIYIPVSQRERLSRTQEDILPGTKVWATDGQIGEVARVELDERTGRLDAFWLRRGSGGELRVPVEWVASLDERGARLAASRQEVETILGPETEARRRG